MRRGLFVAVAVALVAVAVACGPGDGDDTLDVFAAASLAEAFEAVGSAFEEAHPDVDVVLHVAGTPTLVVQLLQGAPADVIAVADEPSLERLVSAGLVAGRPTIFAGNALEIVVAPGNPEGITSLGDLARPGLVVAVGDGSVPVGRYSADALDGAGVTVHHASQEPSATAVVARVALGEADAGIAYVTDVAAAGAQVEGIAIPEAANVVARYPVAVLAGAAEPVAGAAFVELLRSPPGREILTRFGFSPP